MRLPSGGLPEGEYFLDNESREFYTLKGYRLQNGGDITEAMEDYLEMICRHIQENGYIRIHFLAEQLHVRPSSASKMVGKLREMGLVEFEKYGLIIPTERGMAVGRYLLWRHDVLHRFFRLLNHSDCQLEQVEKVEHFMSRETMENLEKLTIRLEG